MQLKKTTSYQRRGGRLSPRRKQLLAHSPFLLQDAKPLQALMQSGAFDQLSLEIGFGMGDHLLEQVQQQPRTLFVGIDIYRPGIATVLSVIDSEQLPNCYLFEGDATDVVLALNSLAFARIDIHHPDPWPKKRHQKRQLLQQAFIATMTSMLTDGGLLQIITDDDAYFAHIVHECQGLESEQLALHLRQNLAPNSKYGLKAQAAGRAINAVELTRRT